MATLEIIADTNIKIRGRDLSYGTARSTSYGYAEDGQIGQEIPAATYFVYRLFLRFDTSVIPASADISDARLRLVCRTDSSTQDFDVMINEYDWSASDPITDGNRETAYDGALASTAHVAWRSTAGMLVDTQYSSSPLTLAYINRLGYTYFAIISSRDHDNTPPIVAEHINFAEIDDATEADRPTLVFTYTFLPFTPRYFFI